MPLPRERTKKKRSKIRSKIEEITCLFFCTPFSFSGFKADERFFVYAILNNYFDADFLNKQRTFPNGRLTSALATTGVDEIFMGGQGTFLS